MKPLILALDQGTTSTRAIVFDLDGRAQAMSQIELPQSYPAPGWVEHDAEEIWRASVQVCREAIDQVGGPSRIGALGVTNQRETVVVWDRSTGRPIAPAIVWQDRRTAETCETLRARGLEPRVQALTGLVLDPYFSAAKIAWLLDKVDGARERARRGALAAGTIDAFLIWRLTGGRRFVTDATNASRTALMDLASLSWSDELGELFRVPLEILPEIQTSAGDFGQSEAALFGRPIPIAGAAGDQQAALVGHGALAKGDVKVTFGTGAFLMAVVGDRPRASRHRLLSTLGVCAGQGRAYAMEGSIFSAGSAVQWLARGLGVVGQSREAEALARSLPDNGGVYLVPGFTGLGAPWWSAKARGAVFGLTRDTGPAHLARAALEAVAYQTLDLLEALAADGCPPPARLRVDGGVTANAFVMQHLADICGLPVERPANQEVTALGAARLAALGAGLISDLGPAPATATAAVWTPAMDGAVRAGLVEGWGRAVRATLAAAPV